jgi:Fe-S-cluster containining protein
MKTSENADAPAHGQLCLACGLCCNGVIFADVKLQPEEDADHLRAIGLRLILKAEAGGPRSAPRTPHFRQPCAALDGCTCRIYSERPKYCRQFECLLLKSVKAGRTRSPAALAIIRDARKRAEKVRRLLRALGDADEEVALNVRFQRTARRLEAAGLDKQAADTYGELTLAVHDLNLLLSERFYPGDGLTTESREQSPTNRARQS